MFQRSFFSSFALLATVVATPVAAQGLTGIEQLAARAAAQGRVRVIVGFARPATASALAPAAAGPADAAHRAALRSLQQDLLASAFGRAVSDAAVAGTARSDEPHAVTLMDVVPALAVTVTKDELSRLTADPRVTSIEEDGLSEPTLIQSTTIIKMTGTTGAWAKGATGTGWIVAVLDTGVAKNHEFLKFDATTTKVVSEACYNTNDVIGSGSISRCPGGASSSTAAGSGIDCTLFNGCGHGTHVAGIAAGKNTSQSAFEPSKGVAYDAGILAIAVFTRFDRTHPSMPCGAGATADCLRAWDSDVIRGLERVYALRGGIGGRRIAAANLSLGGKSFYDVCDTSMKTYKAAIDNLRYSAGIAVVAASGNSGYVNAVATPACISSATAVGATTKTATGAPEKVASYSNMGVQIDLLAPGGDFAYPSTLGTVAKIYSSLPGSYSSYGYLAGTSMAAPHVTGAFAAIRSKSPTCAAKTVPEIESAMKSTGLAIVDSRSAGKYTRPRIDVAKTIALLCP